ncbi:MAG: hypothetical protein R3C32_06740 [Chloroflexota bacterium]
MAFEWWAGDKEGTAAAVDDAECGCSPADPEPAVIPNPMDVRGAIGRREPGNDEYTIWMSSRQTPHIMRLLITAFVLGIPARSVRPPARTWAARSGARSSCTPNGCWSPGLEAAGGDWSSGSTRRENYLATIHGRDHITASSVAGTRDGRVRAAGQDPRPTSADGFRPPTRRPHDALWPGPVGAVCHPQRVVRRSPASIPTPYSRCVPGRWSP